MEHYVIAVRRERRHEAGPNWARPLHDLEGLKIVGDANPYRLRVEATESALEQARQQLASLCIIEPVRPRYALAEISG